MGKQGTVYRLGYKTSVKLLKEFMNLGYEEVLGGTIQM
jgi:hypothetical protein